MPSPLLTRLAGHAGSTRICVADDTGEHTWCDVWTRACAVADALRAAHVGPVEATVEPARVGLLVEPGASFVEALLGTLLAGACAVPLSPQHPDAELTYFLKDSGARIMLASRALAERIAGGVLVVEEVVASAAADVDVAAARRGVDAVGAEAAALQRYGMTEIGVGASNPLDGARRKPGSVGRPLPGVETRVVDERGDDAAAGELWVRGPSLFSGYHGRPDATAAAFAGGWFKTGDTVTVDDDGAICIVGRTSVDIIKSGGYKLSALEIEAVLAEHPAVGEVAVVGLADETWGQRVVACVVPRGASAVDAEDVRAFVRARLAPYKVPREVIVVAELPRNAMGKVVKPTLAERLRVLRTIG